MAFNLRMGWLEMEAFWNDLTSRKREGKLSKDEGKLFKKLVKSLSYLTEKRSRSATDVPEMAAADLNHRHSMLCWARNGVFPDIKKNRNVSA